MRYREGLDLVLKSLNLEIKPGEKIGVCGRTGSGKSSMLVSILRLVESADGAIEVDGVTLGDVALQALRNRVSIIPQESVLFSGDFRFNMDPFNEFTQAEVQEAFDAVFSAGLAGQNKNN